jgi:hypothetical protein
MNAPPGALITLNVSAEMEIFFLTPPNAFIEGRITGCPLRCL